MLLGRGAGRLGGVQVRVLYAYSTCLGPQCPFSKVPSHPLWNLVRPPRSCHMPGELPRKALGARACASSCCRILPRTAIDELQTAPIQVQYACTVRMPHAPHRAPFSTLAECMCPSCCPRSSWKLNNMLPVSNLTLHRSDSAQGAQEASGRPKFPRIAHPLLFGRSPRGSTAADRREAAVEPRGPS